MAEGQVLGLEAGVRVPAPDCSYAPMQTLAGRGEDADHVGNLDGGMEFLAHAWLTVLSLSSCLSLSLRQIRGKKKS